MSDEFVSVIEEAINAYKIFILATFYSLKVGGSELQICTLIFQLLSTRE